MNNIRNDINLREAISRHEQKLPPMPADLNERVMKRLSSLPLTPSEGRGTQSRFSSLSLWIGRLGSLEEPLNVALAPQRGANPHSRRRSGVRLVGAIAATVLLLLAFHFTQKPVEEQPLVAEVPVAAPQPEKPVVTENVIEPQQSTKAEKPQKLAESAKPVKAEKPAEAKENLGSLSPRRGQGVRLEEDLSLVIPADKQALVDIYLAEEALQVAYELQAQQEELRAYAASLMGVEEPQPQSIIAF